MSGIPKIIINTKEQFEELVKRYGPTVDYYTAHMLLGISISRIDQLVRKGQLTDVRLFGKRNLIFVELMD